MLKITNQDIPVFKVLVGDGVVLYFCTDRFDRHTVETFPHIPLALCF